MSNKKHNLQTNVSITHTSNCQGARYLIACATIDGTQVLSQSKKDDGGLRTIHAAASAAAASISHTFLLLYQARENILSEVSGAGIEPCEDTAVHALRTWRTDDALQRALA